MAVRTQLEPTSAIFWLRRQLHFSDSAGWPRRSDLVKQVIQFQDRVVRHVVDGLHQNQALKPFEHDPAFL